MSVKTDTELLKIKLIEKILVKNSEIIPVTETIQQDNYDILAATASEVK